MNLSTNAMENIEKYQKQLLEQTQNLYRETPISEATPGGVLGNSSAWFCQTLSRMGHQRMAGSRAREFG
jgi:hypothetical protein